MLGRYSDLGTSGLGGSGVGADLVFDALSVVGAGDGFSCELGGLGKETWGPMK